MGPQEGSAGNIYPWESDSLSSILGMYRVGGETPTGCSSISICGQVYAHKIDKNNVEIHTHTQTHTLSWVVVVNAFSLST